MITAVDTREGVAHSACPRLSTYSRTLQGILDSKRSP